MFLVWNNILAGTVIVLFLGSFFTLYPRHGRLISINKRHTGETGLTEYSYICNMQ